MINYYNLRRGVKYPNAECFRVTQAGAMAFFSKAVRREGRHGAGAL